MKFWPIGLVLMWTRSSNSAKTTSSKGRKTRHGGTHRLGDSGQIVEERRHRHSVLPYGWADAAGRVLLHQGGNPSARRAPRAICRFYGSGVQPVDSKAQRVHGSERSWSDQPHHLHPPCVSRFLPVPVSC